MCCDQRRTFGPGAARSTPCACRLVEGGAQSFGKLQGVVIGPEVKEDDARLLSQHVAVNRRHLDAVGTQRADHIWNFGSDKDKVARDRRLAAAGWLEVDAGRTPHDRCAYGHPLLADRIAAGYVDRINTAVVGALTAEDLINLGSIEIDRWRLAGGRRRERRLAHRQGVMDGLRHLYGIAMSADMHVERQWLGAQQVIVDRGNIHAAFDQLGHNWADLGLEQHKVAHHHGHITHRLESDPAAERKCRSDRHAVECDLQVRSWKAVAMNGAANRSRSAEDSVDLGPIYALRFGSAHHRQCGAACCENPEHTYHDFLRRWARLPGCLTSHLKSVDASVANGLLFIGGSSVNDLRFLYLLAVLNKPFAHRLLHPASSLDFRRRQAERHAGTKLIDRMSIHNGVAISHVKAEIILHLPNGTDQTGEGS